MALGYHPVAGSPPVMPLIRHQSLVFCCPAAIYLPQHHSAADTASPQDLSAAREHVYPNWGQLMPSHAHIC